MPSGRAFATCRTGLDSNIDTAGVLPLRDLVDANACCFRTARALGCIPGKTAGLLGAQPWKNRPTKYSSRLLDQHVALSLGRHRCSSLCRGAHHVVGVLVGGVEGGEDVSVDAAAASDLVAVLIGPVPDGSALFP